MLKGILKNYKNQQKKKKRIMDKLPQSSVQSVSLLQDRVRRNGFFAFSVLAKKKKTTPIFRSHPSCLPLDKLPETD